MKWLRFSLVAMLMPILSANAECWTVTQLQGKSAGADQQYAFVNDGFSKPVFAVTLDEQSPSVEIVGVPGTYDGGSFASINGYSLVFFAPGEPSNVETWAIDRAQGRAIMTQLKTGQLIQKAAAFVGIARLGCR
jgi:hypothetical protein